MEFYHDILENLLDKLIDYRGKTPKKTLSGIPLVTAKIVKNGTINGYTEFIAEEDYDKWMVRGFPKVGDVILTTEAPLGEVALLKEEKVALAQRIVCLRGKDNVLNNTYLKYYLQSGKGQKSLSARESGTTVTGIKQAELRRVDIEYPTYENQLRIASILSSLDRKIELNNKINADLEEMAQAIFKNWFVDFEPFKDGKFVDSELGMIPEGWKVGTLDEIFSLKYGKNLSTSMILEKGDYPVYGANGIIGYYNDFNCDKYSVLVTSRGNGSGDVSRTHHPKSFITNNSFVVEPLEHYKYIKLPFINGLFNIIDFKSYCSGSAQPQLTNKAMRNICIISPPRELVIKYCEILETLFSHIECVIDENSRLSLLRDTLLPRLMSGELEVPE